MSVSKYLVRRAECEHSYHLYRTHCIDTIYKIRTNRIKPDSQRYKALMGMLNWEPFKEIERELEKNREHLHLGTKAHELLKKIVAWADKYQYGEMTRV